MFGFRTRLGYNTINDDAEPLQTLESASYSNEHSISLEDNLDEVASPEVDDIPPSVHNIAHYERLLPTENHVVTTDGSRWDHVDNLDRFFTRVYEYHQSGGFLCTCLKHIFTLIQFIFVVLFSTFLFEAVDYDVLFNNKNVTADGLLIIGKRRIADAVRTDWLSNFSIYTFIFLLFASIFWMFRLIRVSYQIASYFEIYNFYRLALLIDDHMLCNLTWRDVVHRICERQPSIQLIKNKDGLSPLDVYQRILRYKNYFVALVNQGILPPVLNVPFLGPIYYLSNGLKLNLQWLLFYGSRSPWKGPYELKDEYKHRSNILELANNLRVTVMGLGFFNLVFAPMILIYQLLYSFFSYGELLKREPGSFGVRRYSNFARNKLRHFNELDHELLSRLARSHRPATLYMEQFTSPLSMILAKNVQFVAGAVLGVLIVLSALDEDVLSLEHVLTTITACGVIVVVCRSFIPDENMIWWPESLLNHVILHIHYAPDSWKGKAHTSTVRREFCQFFQLKVQFLLEEIFSPIITPYLLLFHIGPRATEIAEFFHNFTKSVDGLGDVCSFSLLDVQEHGDPTWSVEEYVPDASDKVVANEGKTELSLLYFANNYPYWKPPPASSKFLSEFRNRMERDLETQNYAKAEENILFESLHPYQSVSLQSNRLTDAENSQTLVGSVKGGADYLSSLHMPDNGLNEIMDSTTQSMAVSVAYMRSLRTQNTRSRLGANYGSTSTTVRDVQVGDVWDVPAQSLLVVDSQNVEAIASNSVQLHEDEENVPRPLSENILDDIIVQGGGVMK